MRLKNRKEGSVTNRSSNLSHESNRLPTGSYILMTLITAYLMFFTAVMNEITAFIALALVIAFCATFLHARRLVILIALPTVFGFLSYASFIPVAAVVSVIFIVGFGAAVLLHANRIVVAASFAVAYGASIFFTKDPLLSAGMWLFALCAFLLYVAIAKQMRRTSAICLVAASLLVSFAVIVLVGLWKIAGPLNGELFTTLLSEFHAQLLVAFKESVTHLDPALRPIMTEEVFNGAFDAVLCTLPAIAVISVSVLAFLSHMLTFTVCTASGYLRKLSEKSLVFVLSPVTAVLFILSFVLLLTVPYLADDAQILLLTVENLTLLLMPGLVLVGILGIYGFLAKTPGCLNTWVLLGLALVVFYSRGYLLYLIAFVGVYLTFRVNRERPSAQ